MRNRIINRRGCASVLAAAVGGWLVGAVLGMVAIWSGYVTVRAIPGEISGLSWWSNAFKVLGTWGLIGAVLASLVVFWSVCWRGRGIRD
jgi:hypothetical protein